MAKNRVETGIVQFDDDWPGIFIRGDNAVAYALALGSDEPISAFVVKGLQELLFSVDVARHHKQDVRHLSTHKAGNGG